MLTGQRGSTQTKDRGETRNARKKKTNNGNIEIQRRKKKKNGIISMVKWSWGDNRRLRDMDWLGYTSILSFFNSLPSLFLLRFDDKLTQFQYLFYFFCISNTKHTSCRLGHKAQNSSYECVVKLWGFGWNTFVSVWGPNCKQIITYIIYLINDICTVLTSFTFFKGV